jgi:hypothetical protein
MGLFVVGRLAARHGVRVQLRPSGEQSGTTSLVMLPDAITHGGGGQETPEEDFHVSRIVPEQPRPAPQHLLDARSAAEFGFDDSRYEKAEPAHGTPREGDRSPAAHQLPTVAEAESHTGVPDQAQDHVGFDGPGPSPSGYRSVTGAGLPRRDPGRAPHEEGPTVQFRPEPESGEQPQRPLPPQPGPADPEPRWSSPNDESWDRAGRLRAPQAGGVTDSGLPRRVPRANLVAGAAEQTRQGGPQVSRAPEDVRGRLSNLHRGTRRARSASDADQNDRQGFGPGSTYDQER